MKQTKKQLNQTKINLAVDSGIFFGFLIAEAPHFTGMAVHEWLGIAFGAGIITHLLLHWQWIVKAIKRYIVQPLSFGHPVAQPSRVTKLTQKGVRVGQDSSRSPHPSIRPSLRPSASSGHSSGLLRLRPERSRRDADT